MPWSAGSFRSKHWKSASPAQASSAAKMATAMVKSGTDEGVAIATAIKHAKRAHKGFGGSPSKPGGKKEKAK